VPLERGPVPADGGSGPEQAVPLERGPVPAVPLEGGSKLWPVILERGPKTLVVAGFGAGPEAAELAAAGGWPLVSEPVSGAWFGPNAVRAGRIVVELLGRQVERVVAYGRPVLSRPVTRLIQDAGVELITVHSGGAWFDLGRRGRLASHATVAASGGPNPEELAWLEAWLAAGPAVGRVLAALDDPTGPAVAAALAAAAFGQGTGGEPGSPPSGAAAPAEAPPSAEWPVAPRSTALPGGPPSAESSSLVVGSSSAIRDLDLAEPPRTQGAPPPACLTTPAPTTPPARLTHPARLTPQAERTPAAVAALRGVAGIDGTVSFATGVNLAQGGLTRVLLGDLALLHDVGALLTPACEQRPNLQIVVLADGGGGIFEGLEVAHATPPGLFERFFATPAGVDWAALAAAYGLAFAEPQTLAELVNVLANPPIGVSLVKVALERGQRRTLERRLVQLSRNDPAMFSGFQ
jgi:2-succinyl-5-enolpyruvyl-6-hydroxy-3-cyclohexene-1-carboxylate synthase